MRSDGWKAAVEIHGVRLAGELKVRMLFDDPDAIRLYRLWRDGAADTIHLQYPGGGTQGYPRPNWWYGGSIEALERAVAALPETILSGTLRGSGRIFRGRQSRGGGLPQGAGAAGRQDAGDAADIRQSVCGSVRRVGGGGISRDRAFGRNFLIEFQDKLLFARDNFGFGIDGLSEELDLPEEAFDKIAYQNAQKLVSAS